MDSLEGMKWKPLLFNAIFWLAYFLYEWLAIASVYSEYTRYLINALVIVPITMGASLYTVHFLFRRLYLQGRKGWFWIGLFPGMAAFAMVRRSFNYFYTYPLYYPDGQEMPLVYLPKLIIEGMNIYLFVGLYSMFYFFREWYEKDRLARELGQEKTRAELKLLKSQVQPHFIFNTLNNIYSYAIQKNERTPDLIYQLSSFLSYGLYDSKPEFVPLSRELGVIESYVELEKVRVGDRLDVSINVFDPIDEIQVPPLLLLPLMENSFKHGVGQSLEKCWIRMDVARNSEELVIKCENSLVAEEGKDAGSGAAKGTGNKGLGLENVRRRLELVYPERHELRCELGKDSYLLVLKIRELPCSDA